MSNQKNIIVALDFDSEKSVFEFVAQLDPSLCRLKIGKELFTALGPALVEKLMYKDFEIFLDLKFHDIPNTVAAACAVAANLGVWMLNVHALGGRCMLEAASNAVAKKIKPPLLIAVTILTSMDKTALAELGLMEPEVMVAKLAKLAQECGIDGVVSSAQEARALKALCGKDFLLVTPGIRLTNAIHDDQKRTMTPKDAILAGSDYLVIGRPITQSRDPYQTLIDISRDIGNDSTVSTYVE